MALFQASLGLLFLGQLLLSSSCLASTTCEVIIPVNTDAKLGEKVVLQCRLNSQNIAWTFCARGSGPSQIAVNCELGPSTAGKYRLDKSTTNACHLVIDSVTVNHFGKYTCQDWTLDEPGHTVELGNANENMALNKPTVQSSTYDVNSGANMAVDGVFPLKNRDHCSSTKAAAPEWLVVDLGQETPIGRVRITSRRDAYPEQLNNFFIGLTNVSPSIAPPSVFENSSICKYYVGHPPLGVPTNIICDPATEPGRYLFVYFRQAQALTICELEAYIN